MKPIDMLQKTQPLAKIRQIFRDLEVKTLTVSLLNVIAEISCIRGIIQLKIREGTRKCEESYYRSREP